MAQLIGLARLGRDAELRYLESGTAVINLPMAYNYGRKDEDGNRPTQWIEGALWGKRAESLAGYLTKGKLVMVVLDDVHVETYEMRDGTTGTKIAGTISSIEFAGSAPQQDGGAAPQQRQQPAPQRQAAPQQRQAAPQRQAPQQQSSAFNDMDDDIPF